jgi:hypothetical protein
MANVNIFWIEIGDRIEQIDRIAPKSAAVRRSTTAPSNYQEPANQLASGLL